MDARTLQELTTIAVEVAREAGALVLSGYRAGVSATEKGRADLVTEFDLASEALIRTRLQQRTPGLPMVGEETGGQPSGPTWYCDPIDGTTNFVHGHPFFCVSLGLMDGGTPLAGVVFAPALGTCWRGVVGDGALRDGQPCHVSDTRELRNALLATGFHPRNRTDPAHDNRPTFARMIAQVRGIRRCGSAALDLCMTADGTYDAYWERTLSVWDTAGGAAIALAAGATVTDLAGGPVDLSIGHLIVSNGHLHGAIQAVVSEPSS